MQALLGSGKGFFLIGINASPAPLAGTQCSPYQYIVNWQNDNRAEVIGKYDSDKRYKRVIGLAPSSHAGKDFDVGQRKAAGRTLLVRPELFITDEPSSAPDDELRDALMGVLLEDCAAAGSALMFVSNPRLAARFDRIISIAELAA